MADGEHTGFPQVSAPASAAVHEEEEENNEDEEAGNSDDDEDMDDINHTTLPYQNDARFEAVPVRVRR